MAQPPPVIDDPTGALASSREEETARALAARYHLEYVDVASFAPDPEILKSVPVDLMFMHRFSPAVEGGFGGAWRIGDSADASFRYLIDARLNFIF